MTSGQETSSAWSGRLRAFVSEAPKERTSIADFVASVAARTRAGARVADVGAGSAPFRELFAHADYVTIDHDGSPHGGRDAFDIVASADDIPVAAESFDLVLCTQVLEHVARPAAVLGELFRILRPGGRLALTAPLAWEEHERPHDYFRYTRSGLEHLLGDVGFTNVAIRPRTDGFTTLAQLVESARWSLGETTGEDADRRHATFLRLQEIADELQGFADQDARGTFPLGYTAEARRPGDPTVAPAPTAREACTAPATKDRRRPILYLAPWVDLGGSDKGTIDWFRNIDLSRWAPSLITTQPSDNRWLHQIEPYAEEIWSLPEIMSGVDFAPFVLGFIRSRNIEVVHNMNSRLGFDLLPDMAVLERPPVLVVQLHAEEHDRSGYVRYVSSRYGSLVDAFSVTSRQLSDAMRDYDVAESKKHVIPTGVDAIGEFDPSRVARFEGLDGTGLQILWPGRLVSQKDPMLTLDVLRELADRGVDFTLHVVGDGDMAPEVRERARASGLEDHIRWYPPSREMPRWYASTDVLLMTSVFEGVPYVMYEALAMGLPVVVPALPGNVELMAEGGGVLVDPRDDVGAYADALQRYAEDEELRSSTGRAARERMLADHSLPDMARAHEELYESLLDSGPATLVGEPEPSLPEPVTFARSAPPPRTVAVIVPCYQHGKYLPECIASIKDQTLAASRIVVVDDASPDVETRRALDALDQDPAVTVVRQARNGGPSAARNRALALVQESYVLPLDADDMLLPRALEEMVGQLESAPERVGFVYPNVQHFGTRHDRWEPPAYNLYLLLNVNYCAATSLFDRRVFDAGIRYDEELTHGHEDWDLVLRMAEHGVEGVRAQDLTFLYRKSGFSRVNAAEFAPEAFDRAIRRRHPELFENRARIKAAWAPGVSVLVLERREQSWAAEALAALSEQTCIDHEVIVVGGSAGGLDPVTRVKSFGPEGVAEALELARGRIVVLVEHEALESLGRKPFLEQVVRVLHREVSPERLVLARADAPLVPMRLLDNAEAEKATPIAACWRREPDAKQPDPVWLWDDDAVRDVVASWRNHSAAQWRTA